MRSIIVSPRWCSGRKYQSSRKKTLRQILLRRISLVAHILRRILCRESSSETFAANPLRKPSPRILTSKCPSSIISSNPWWEKGTSTSGILHQVPHRFCRAVTAGLYRFLLLLLLSSLVINRRCLPLCGKGGPSYPPAFSSAVHSHWIYL